MPRHPKTPTHAASRLALLGGRTTAEFLRRYWQRQPLLVHSAWPGFEPVLTRTELFALAAHDDVESRLVSHSAKRGWRLRHGPFARRGLPPLKRRGWTLLVQGVDLHDDRARALLDAFRFLPDARVDDLMISWASEGGGVGPHVDSYDVFLLQAHGRRRWRIGKTHDPELEPGAPLKLLRNFVATEEHLLEPGDLLYLPPQWAHHGIATTPECMTYSIGMRAPERGALAAEIVARLGDALDDPTLYRDPGPKAGPPAEVPAALQEFAADAVRRLVAGRGAIERALGELLSEPKPHVWFEQRPVRWRAGPVALDRRTRMLYDARHVFINGESVRAAGDDLAVLKQLANARHLDARAVRRASRRLRALLAEWFRAGWLERAR